VTTFDHFYEKPAVLLNRAAFNASEKKQDVARERILRGKQSEEFRLTRRRILAARRRAQIWRLRLSIVGVLILLAVITTTGSRTTERLVQRQQTINSAYRSHLLFTDMESAVKDGRGAASCYIHEGNPAQRTDYQRSSTEARKLLLTIESRSSVPHTPSSARERYTDLLPRIRLYLDAIETGVRLRDAQRQQAAIKGLLAADSAYEKLAPLSHRLRAEEERQLAELTDELEQEAERQRSKMWLWTSLAVVLLGVAGLIFSRDMGARTRQEWALRSANRTLTRLAQQDGLTHLKNRRALEEELHTEWARARRGRTSLSLLFVDVDKFKEYNDTFGHQAGDEALKQVAALLRQEERLSPCCVARYGGEEFAIVLPETDSKTALKIGERVRASFESASWQGRPVTASVGAATISQGIRGRFSDVETLLYEADGALYHAKRAGRNQVAHAADLFPLPPRPPLAVKR
jgi:diguanylate cyclase (GGDEF)-like protein